MTVSTNYFTWDDDLEWSVLFNHAHYFQDLTSTVIGTWIWGIGGIMMAREIETLA